LLSVYVRFFSILGKAMGALAHDLQELRTRLENRFGRAILPLREEGSASERGFRIGLEALDRILPGGVPRGALTLWTGEASCGRTATLRALVAHACEIGAGVAVVDVTRTLTPAFACGEEEALPGLWMVRPPVGWKGDGGWAVEALLRAGIFQLVVLDGPLPPALAAHRLRALAREHGAALVLAAPGRGAEWRADLRVEFLAPARGGGRLGVDGRLRRQARVRVRGGSLQGGEEEMELSLTPTDHLPLGPTLPDRSPGSGATPSEGL
jgi:hypothetical protein